MGAILDTAASRHNGSDYIAAPVLDAGERALLDRLSRIRPHSLSESALTRFLNCSPAELVLRIEKLNLTLSAAGNHAFVAWADGSYFLAGPVTSSISARPVMPSLVGRSEALGHLVNQIVDRRFITIVGAGGIGKTSVALALADRLADSFGDACCVIELAPLSDRRLLPLALASALRMPPDTGDIYADLARFLCGKKMLVILDSCEHMIDEAARAAEALRAAAPDVYVLATSREPLMAMGEWVYRLAALGLPPEGSYSRSEQVLAYPAVRLFVDRAREVLPDFALDAGGITKVVHLCRALDGIPLALELAAALMGEIGLDKLAEQLHSKLLGGGIRRGPAARHQTLRAVLDWSVDLLPPAERRVLCQLAIFRNGFTLDAVSGVLSDPASARDELVDCVLNLMTKSLIAGGGDEQNGRLRLLDTTRAYAWAQLAASGELPALHQRHAHWVRALLLRSEEAWTLTTRDTWLDTYLPWIDDVRLALDWAFGPEGEVALGVEIAGLSLGLATMAHLGSEFIRRAEVALASSDAGTIGCDEVLELRLRQYGYFGAIFNGVRMPTDSRKASLLAAAALVDDPKRQRFQTGPFVALWGCSYGDGDYPAALHWAGRIRALGDICGDPAISLVGSRTLAQSLHFSGRHQEALDQAMLALADAGRRVPLAYLPNQIEVRTSVDIVMSRIFWIQGKPLQARHLAEACLARADTDAPDALCHIVAMALFPIVFWAGDRQACAALNARLIERAQRYGLDYWLEWGRAYAGMLDAESDLDLRRVAAAAGVKLADNLATFDTAMLTQTTRARVEQGSVGWCAPEVMRARAEQMLKDDPFDRAGAARTLLDGAQRLAREQGALAWELRIATSLVRLARRDGGGGDESAALEDIYDRFTEGHATPDLCTAKALLRGHREQYHAA